MSATSAAAQSYNRWLVTNHRFFWRINPKIRRFSKRRIWLQKANCTNNPPKVVKKKKKQEPIQSNFTCKGPFCYCFRWHSAHHYQRLYAHGEQAHSPKAENRVRHVPSKFRFKKGNGGIPKWSLQEGLIMVSQALRHFRALLQVMYKRCIFFVDIVLNVGRR